GEFPFRCNSIDIGAICAGQRSKLFLRCSADFSGAQVQPSRLPLVVDERQNAIIRIESQYARHGRRAFDLRYSGVEPRVDVGAGSAAGAGNSEDYLIGTARGGCTWGTGRGLPLALAGERGKRQPQQAYFRNSGPARKSSSACVQVYRAVSRNPI